MAQYTVISEVSQTLLNLLRGALTPDMIKKNEQVALCAPSKQEDVKVGIHLYDIQENGDFLTRTMIPKGEGSLQFPPQSLTLYYMITVYSNADKYAKAIDEQRIMGRVLQILADHPRLEGNQLVGSLKDYEEGFEIIRENLKFEDKIKLWQFPNLPYQLSMVYKVQPIRLESTRTKAVTRVTSASIHVEGK